MEVGRGRFASRRSLPLCHITISTRTDRAVQQEQEVQIYQW